MLLRCVGPPQRPQRDRGGGRQDIFLADSISNRYRLEVSRIADGCPMIIVLAQTKGGVGKSTLALNLAIARARAGADVLLVDADEQATATDFTALRTERLGSPGYAAISLTGPHVRPQ